MHRGSGRWSKNFRGPLTWVASRLKSSCRARERLIKQRGWSVLRERPTWYPDWNLHFKTSASLRPLRRSTKDRKGRPSCSGRRIEVTPTSWDGFLRNLEVEDDDGEWDDDGRCALCLLGASSSSANEESGRGERRSRVFRARVCSFERSIRV